MFTFAQNFGLQFPDRDARLKGNQVILPLTPSQGGGTITFFLHRSLSGLEVRG